MAKVKTKNNTGVKVTEKELWEYEYRQDEWIPEDDKRSASYKAVKTTGRIRSCVQTTTLNRVTGGSVSTQTPWQIQQASI